MVISTGTRLGPYEVVSPLGAGGMGEVWKARDTRLERSVAIKVLPAEFAQNAQLKLRFEREAKTISQLNHPHICTLYDVGDGYLVMELLEGESLADRLTKGPLPITEVLRFGAQIADALDRAHRAGIVHRDLKPANIMLTRSGAKLLDFGLAKTDVAPLMLDGATQQRPLTKEGTILGTFQYMAPEQLEGLEADGRTDIFALGALLYEMATGKRAFEGTSKTSLIAAIVTSQPAPISAIQPLTPPAFEHVVSKCLAKDRDARWQSAYDVAEELRWIGEAGSQAGVATPMTIRRRRRATWITALIALAIATAAAAAAWFVAERTTRTIERADVYRLTIPTPPGSVVGYTSGTMALSPDGKLLTYASYGRDGNQILVRKLSETNWVVLNGTTGACNPFWSPDSRFIGYFARGSLWKVSADGTGSPEEIVHIPDLSPTAAWGGDGTIIVSTAETLYRVSASGGEAAPIRGFEKPPKNSVFGSRPQFLPDGRHFIYDVAIGTDAVRFLVGSIDGKGTPVSIGTGDNNAVLAGDDLVFVRGGVLYGQPFDLHTYTLKGEPKAIAKVQSLSVDMGYFTVAGDTLVYLPQGSEVRTELLRVDRSGHPLGRIGEPAFFFSPRISHSGTRVAVDESATTGPGDIWILDAKTNSATRMTFAPENETAPIWSPDDADLIYVKAQHDAAANDLMRKHVASGQPIIALRAAGSAWTGDWSPDGNWFLAQIARVQGAAPQITIYRTADWKAQGPAIAGIAPRFSPDGRWFAYSSQESSRIWQVFVEPFPPNGSKWQISSDSGAMPVWRADGKALYFVNDSGKLVEAPIAIAPDGSVSSQAAQPLFPVALREGVVQWAQYGVFADGTFLLNEIPDTASTPMIAMIHWQEALGGSR